jgi:ankyrin repeat protein
MTLQHEQHGATPLIRASREGHVTTVQALVHWGASINARESVRLTAAFFSIVSRFKLNASLTESQNGATALMVASSNGHEEVVRILLAAGANRSDGIFYSVGVVRNLSTSNLNIRVSVLKCLFFLSFCM